MVGLLSTVLLAQVAGKKNKPFYLDILPFSTWPIEAIVDDRTFTGMSLKHGESEHLAPFIFWEGSLDGPHFFTPILDDQNKRYTYKEGESNKVLKRYSLYYYDFETKELILMKESIDPRVYHSPEDLKELAVELISVRLHQSNQRNPINN